MIDATARNNMTKEAGAEIQAMLSAGLIVNGQVQEGAIAETLFGQDPTAIRLGSSFFLFRHPGDAAQVLGHELGHVKQKEIAGLIYGERMDRAEWWALIRKRGDGGVGDEYFAATQRDADKFGCSVAIGVVNMRIGGRCQ